MNDTSKSAVIRARVDVREVAAIAMFYKRRGIPIGNRNQLVNRIIEDWYMSLLYSEELQPIESTAEAASMLEDLGMKRLAEDVKASKCFISQVGKESLHSEEPTLSLADLARKQLSS